MRFLVDECLSTRVPELLVAAGHDAVHVVDCGLAGEPDERVLAQAADDRRVLLSADTDFGEILARSGSPVPSVILFRRAAASPSQPGFKPMLSDLSYASGTPRHSCQPSFGCISSCLRR